MKSEKKEKSVGQQSVVLSALSFSKALAEQCTAEPLVISTHGYP